MMRKAQKGGGGMGGDGALVCDDGVYAFNGYYLKHGMTDNACSFSDTAALTSLNPSHGDRKFPSSKTGNNANVSETIIGGMVMGPNAADLSASHPISILYF
ncbi:Glucan endo-1 3-beta-glucosidase [Corchorus capsularis]|uniref:Glucan endo-1 3-beta-glucosidase n=1 Tax=Corchorus capsularis TaxID=210143 RepID=A0A1R3K5G6_COCAP|nr:Glucan endo-1 3-beta-glucosidase [Corchorus capsularis]